MRRKLSVLRHTVKDWYAKNKAKVQSSMVTTAIAVNTITIPASADTYTVSDGITDVKTIVTYCFDMIEGHWYLLLFVVLSLVGYGFGVIKKAKRAVK